MNEEKFQKKHTAYGDRNKSDKNPTPEPSSSKSNEMVPITYDLLRDLYSKFPTPSVSPDLETLKQEVTASRNNLLSTSTSTSTFSLSLPTTVNDILAEQIPPGLDQGMYTLRCSCEEAARRLLLVPSLASYSTTFTDIAAMFDSFQKKQSEQVSQLVNDFLPQDFRLTLFNAARQQGERSNVNAVNDLMASGGSIRDKYKLLWEQQYKRRETLANIGNSAGLFKFIVKYLAGVPEPLLQFAKELNEKKGPTEALREKFGPSLLSLTKFTVELNALTSVVCSSRTANSEVEDCLQRSLTLFEGEVKQFLTLLENVLCDSPFFVKSEEIAKFQASQTTRQ